MDPNNIQQQDPFESATSHLFGFISHLSATQKLYYSTSNSHVRNGILYTMRCISPGDLTGYCALQPYLTIPFIDARASNESPLNFFHFADMYATHPDDLRLLINTLARLCVLFHEPTLIMQAISGLFTYGMYPLISYPPFGLDNDTCNILVAHVNRYLFTCLSAEAAMQPFFPPTRRIIPTGGDVHVGATPLIFSAFGHNKVWKPRCMDAERQVHNAISVLNNFLAPPYRLPVLDSMLFPQPRFWNTGFIEFANHADVMTRAQASAYARKLGVLMFFAKAIGLSDIHYENIMATLDGPALIDAECCFLPEIVCDAGPLKTGLGMLSDPRAKDSNSDFIVEGAHFCEIYKTAFLAEINDGFTVAAQVFTPPAHAPLVNHAFQALLNAYRIATGSGIRPRTVPLATMALQGTLVSLPADRPDMRVGTISRMSTYILSTFAQSHMGFPALNTIPAAVLTNLQARLFSSFGVGDVPLFMLEENATAPWRLYLDGHEVIAWPAPTWAMLGADFTANLVRLSQLQTPF